MSIRDDLTFTITLALRDKTTKAHLREHLALRGREGADQLAAARIADQIRLGNFEVKRGRPASAHGGSWHDGTPETK